MDGWMDTDLEGLVGEDRQMRREEGGRIRCPIQCLNTKVGPEFVKTSNVRPGERRRPLNRLHARMGGWMQPGGVEITETVLTQKFSHTTDNTVCVY